MTQIIAVASHKGGVGKTTTRLNLAPAFVADGQTTVLLCDLEPPGLALETHRRRYAGPYTHPLWPADTNAAAAAVSPEPGARRTHYLDGRVSIIPGSGQLAKFETQLVSKLNRERTLRPLSESFSFVLFDCPPSLNLLTMNALAAADEVLIPVASEYLALQALQDVLDIAVEEVRAELNPDLKIAGILVASARRGRDTPKASSGRFARYFLTACSIRLFRTQRARRTASPPRSPFSPITQSRRSLRLTGDFARTCSHSCLKN